MANRSDDSPVPDGQRQPTRDDVSSRYQVTSADAFVTPTPPPPPYRSTLPGHRHRPPLRPLSDFTPVPPTAPPTPWVDHQQQHIPPQLASDGSLSSFPSVPADLSLTFLQDMYQRNAELTSIIHQLSPLLRTTQQTTGQHDTQSTTYGSSLGANSPLPPHPTDVLYRGNTLPISANIGREAMPPSPPVVETVFSSQHSIITSNSEVTDPSPISDIPASDLAVTYDVPQDSDRLPIHDHPFPTDCPIHVYFISKTCVSRPTTPAITVCRWRLHIQFSSSAWDFAVSPGYYDFECMDNPLVILGRHQGKVYPFVYHLAHNPLFASQGFRLPLPLSAHPSPAFLTLTVCRSPYRKGFPIDKVPRDQIAPEDKPRLVKRYQSVVGQLIWLQRQTRPDISAVTHLLARFSHDPSFGHYKAAKRVLSYLKGTLDRGIRFTQGGSSVNVTLHSPCEMASTPMQTGDLKMRAIQNLVRLLR